MEPKFYLIFLTALIPLFVGMIWYNRSVFGSAWMQATGMTEEKGKNINMILVFGLTYVLGLLISMACAGMSIHQMSVGSIFQGDETAESKEYLKHFFEMYGTRFRSFKHGVLHGVIGSIMVAAPIVGVSTLFEGRSFKYFAITVGYWMVCFALIAGTLCAFM
ncbi:MAG: DUF1761 domain-containing protein [Chitinophagaceae bacterium]|nr:DUF1761 domain-containing protein [Chitinophagaceae bacterium]